MVFKFQINREFVFRTTVEIASFTAVRMLTCPPSHPLLRRGEAPRRRGRLGGQLRPLSGLPPDRRCWFLPEVSSELRRQSVRPLHGLWGLLEASVALCFTGWGHQHTHTHTHIVYDAVLQLINSENIKDPVGKSETFPSNEKPQRRCWTHTATLQNSLMPVYLFYCLLFSVLCPKCIVIYLKS